MRWGFLLDIDTSAESASDCSLLTLRLGTVPDDVTTTATKRPADSEAEGAGAPSKKAVLAAPSSEIVAPAAEVPVDKPAAADAPPPSKAEALLAENPVAGEEAAVTTPTHA